MASQKRVACCAQAPALASAHACVCAARRNDDSKQQQQQRVRLAGGIQRSGACRSRTRQLVPARGVTCISRSSQASMSRHGLPARSGHKGGTVAC
jgi:hypothetical protein